MVPMHEVYLVLLAQMFVMETVSMEQYSQLQTHIYSSELLTQSEATVVIFSQSTIGEASNEEAMSCDDKVSVVPPAVLKPSGNSQILQGTTLCQVLAQQPPPSLLPLQTPKTPASSGWTSVLEKLFGEVPSQQSQTAVPTPHTWTHSMESRESRGSTGSKQKVHPSGGANVEPPEKQQHHSCSDDTVFIMMDSITAATPEPVAKEPPTPSLEKVAPSSNWGWPTCSVAGHSRSGGSTSYQVHNLSEESMLNSS